MKFFALVRILNAQIKTFALEVHITQTLTRLRKCKASVSMIHPCYHSAINSQAFFDNSFRLIKSN